MPAQPRYRPDLFPPDQADGLGSYKYRFLAEGDSWFSIGTLNALQGSNLLTELRFDRSITAIVNCAYPGDTLQQMVDGLHGDRFDRLLRAKNFASQWDALLISAGGNDLIAAAEHGPVHRDGHASAPEERILLTPEEAAATHPTDTSAARYISEPGWALLAGYLRQNLETLVARREQGPSAGRPLILHTYSAPVVRPAGIPGAAKGWLFPAFETYRIPPADRQPLAELLFQRLQSLWLSAAQALPAVHVFDSARLVALAPAQPGSTGVSGDWVNEIHLTPAGYRKIGVVMGPWIEQLLA